MKKFFASQRKIRLWAIALLLSPLLHAAGNAEKGKEKAVVCIACHGEKGVSLNPVWPNLAGQHASYLLKQLKDFKIGKERSNPSMTPIVAILNQQDFEDLAVYYAQMPSAKGVTPKNYLKRGEQLYRGGDFAKHITACIACHGPSGTGNGPAAFPALSGQHAAYTIAQLTAYKNNQRRNDLNHIMRDISARMDEKDMEAVAYYIQGLH